MLFFNLRCVILSFKLHIILQYCILWIINDLYDNHLHCKYFLLVYKIYIHVFFSRPKSGFLNDTIHNDSSDRILTCLICHINIFAFTLCVMHYIKCITHKVELFLVNLTHDIFNFNYFIILPNSFLNGLTKNVCTFGFHRFLVQNHP